MMVLLLLQSTGHSARSTGSSTTNERVLVVARSRVASSSTVVMGTLQRVLDYPQESAKLGTSKED